MDDLKSVWIKVMPAESRDGRHHSLIYESKCYATKEDLRKSAGLLLPFMELELIIERSAETG